MPTLGTWRSSMAPRGVKRSLGSKPLPEHHALPDRPSFLPFPRFLRSPAPFFRISFSRSFHQRTCTSTQLLEELPVFPSHRTSSCLVRIWFPQQEITDFGNDTKMITMHPLPREALPDITLCAEEYLLRIQHTIQ